MKSLPRLFAALLLPVLVLGVLAGCSGIPKTTTKTLTSIAVTPATPAHLKVGATQQFTATGTYSDSTTADITSTVTWNSGTPATATISAAGLATGVAAGTTAITATLGTVTSPGVTLTVISLASIAVTPATPAHLKVGATQQFTATGTYSDSTTADITSTVTWNSGTPATATISAAGLATGVAAGTTAITATLGTVTSPGVTLTVIAVTSIAVTPNPASVAVSATVQLTATGTYSDASTADISSQVTWACAPSTVATISASGLATAGAANGTCQVTATLGAVVSPGVTLTVGTGGVPVAIAVKIVQVNPTIAVGGAEDFTALFQLSDGTTTAPTAAVTWSSGTAATASIIANSGISVGLAQGTSLITATSGTLVPGTTTLTVVPAVTRFAYVSGFSNDVATASYVVNSANSTLTSFGVLRDTLFPAQVVPEPSGRFAYAIGANTNGTVGVYTVDSVTGSLTATNTGFTAGQTAPGPQQAIIDPTGQFLYILNGNTNNITALHINSVDGSLSCLGTPAPAPPCTAYGGATLNFPLGFVEDRAGKYLYVSNNGGNNLSGFLVGADGSLTPLSTPTFATGGGPGLPAIDPSNGFLYVPNNGDNTVSVFSIAPATGLLTELATSPFSTGVGAGPVMAAVTPSNKFLYVTNQDGTISGITIGAGGALGTAVPGSPYTTGSAGNFPYGLAIDAAGSFLVAVNNTDNTLAYFTIDGTTGALTLTSTVETRTVPQQINLYAGIAAPTVAPATVEAANAGNGAGTGSVSSYTVNSGTGALTTAATSPTTTLDGNNQAYASTAGKFFYTASSTGKKLDGFTVDSAAALTGLPSNATDLTPAVPGSIYAEIGDQFVYVADTGNAAVVALNNDPTLGLTTNSTLSGLTSVNAIAGDAQGTLIFALGSGQLQSIPIDQSGGAISAPAALTLSQAGNWTSGAVDPSARFLVAADSTGKQLSSFSVIPLGSGTTSGLLTATGSNTALGGSGNYSITFDPLGRFVFVADTTNGTVAVFSFNSSGATTAVGTATTVSASGVTSIAVEANGKYLYVGTKGNGTTVAGTVAVYTIGSTGTLTAGTPVNAAIGTSAVTVTNSVN